MPRICITVPNQAPQPYSLPAGTQQLTIGRAPDNDMVLDHASISSRHCEMKLVEGGYILSDAGSTNGIHYNQEVMDVIDLKDGMEVLIGDILFSYDLSEEEKETFTAQNLKPRQRKKRQKTTHPSNAVPVPPHPHQTTPVLASSQNSAGKDFAVFVAFVTLALGAFWLGLSSAHKKATKSEEDRYGRSLWSDITKADEPEAEES